MSVPDKAALLESLADTRIELLYLEQKAKEAGDKAAAKELAARGAALKTRIVELRRLAHAEWVAAATPLEERFRKAVLALEKVLERDAKRRKAVNAAARAVAAVDDVLTLTAKVLV